MGFACVGNSQTNRRQNSFHLPKNLTIPKVQHLETCLLQSCRPLLVALHLHLVLPAIYFDHQTDIQADEIEDVIAIGMLAAEFHSHLLQTQMAPEMALSFGHGSPQTLRDFLPV